MGCFGMKQGVGQFTMVARTRQKMEDAWFAPLVFGWGLSLLWLGMVLTMATVRDDVDKKDSLERPDVQARWLSNWMSAVRRVGPAHARGGPGSRAGWARLTTASLCLT